MTGGVGKSEGVIIFCGFKCEIWPSRRVLSDMAAGEHEAVQNAVIDPVSNMQNTAFFV